MYIYIFINSASMNELNEKLIKEISNICVSYLSENEQIYIKKEWYKFDLYSIWDTATTRGWIDLLEWIVGDKKNYSLNYIYWEYIFAEVHNGNLEALKRITQNGKIYNSDHICRIAKKKGYLHILNWIKTNGCICDGIYH